MNLIEKFEDMLAQDVGTFNSIFTTTPILGFNSDVEVRIGELCNGNQRKILVGSEVLLMDLTQKKSVKKEKKITFIKPKGGCTKVSANISNIYKILKPTEFMIYSAIKEVGEVDGIEELARKISVSNKTIISNLPRLIQLGLVKKKYVTVIGKTGSFNKLIVDTSVTL